MKVVVLCGGLGTRLAEETSIRPKPMVQIAGQPILTHIMNIYSSQGFSDFVLALGYKGESIKEYFLNYHTLSNDLSIDMSSGKIETLKKLKSDWKVTLIDTGAETLTGGRLHRLEKNLAPHGTFMLTYGDGVANINVKELLEFHKSHGKIATITAVRPPARFGCIQFNGNQIVDFLEKPQMSEGWINGGFMVFEPEVFKYLEGDKTILEATPLERLAKDGQLMGYHHTGFWHCMDTLRDKQVLEQMWNSKSAPWKVWE